MLDLSNAHTVFSIYGKFYGPENKDRRLLGRVLIHNGQLLVLEDHEGVLKELHTGPLAGVNENILQDMSRSSYMDIVNEGDVVQGKRVDLIPEYQFKPQQIDDDAPQVERGPDYVEDPAHPQEGQDLSSGEGAPQIEKPEPIFDYMRVGMLKPQVLEIHENVGYLNGQKLEPQELERIKYNVKNGLATLRYRKRA